MMKRLGQRSGTAGTVGLLCALLAACGGGGVADKPVGPGKPPVDTTKTPPTGTVQRATLVVTVSFDSTDAALASTAGVSVAGITVRIQRGGFTEAAHTAVTGADGIARFDQLLEGTYQVSADRPLSTAEVARLPESEREASLFAGGAQLTVTPPQGQAVVQLVASRRGSLVVSEVFLYRSGAPNFYGFGTYFEVYNNADTTSYLDGVLVFSTPVRLHADYGIYDGCTGNVAHRLDSLRIWASLVWAFPGSGRDYPIRPGEAKVIAMDAINHHAASPTTGQVDLSKADFEEIGTDADINNAFVPDLIRVRAGTGALGRGYPTNYSRTYGLALPSARTEFGVTASLPAGEPMVRVPREAVLDLAAISMTPAVIAALTARGHVIQYCEPWLLPMFERAPAPLGDFTTRKAIARRSLGRTAAGHEILQRTHTSARDFTYAEPLRRSLLK